MTIPEELMKDRYWRGTLYLFTEHSLLQRYIATHIDFAECTIDITGLKRISKPWSQSEKFILCLALHLFNESNKVNLSDMDSLDPNNKELVFEALQLRFG
ncbi:hypothetical protein ACP8HI_04340 [Paenibacillus sp. FA6]|uniref:hypothetical protein n=1 Tax=Paenibacillus sp. FA6 TaxID=3413029 RepID=UPI003F65A45B